MAKLNMFQQMVIDKLLKLGNSVDAVRKSLAKAKITGEPQEAVACPLANYLRDECGIDDVSVAHSEISIDGVKLALSEVPGFINNFITKFDEREFPELIDPDYLNEDEAEALKKRKKK